MLDDTDRDVCVHDLQLGWSRTMGTTLTRTTVLRGRRRGMLLRAGARQGYTRAGECCFVLVFHRDMWTGARKVTDVCVCVYFYYSGIELSPW